ncbi:MAG: Gfo/Idh/MocA family oxidoreductase [Bryobacteraceae bacterium]|nr:Gfo/Idh/MocA family oxidoreductase [Bryobacteraceae bacterium]
MERRNFLLTSALGAAHAAEGRIRAALYGTRHSHARGKLKAMLDNPDFEVVGVCEPDEAAWKKAVDMHQHRRLKEDEMLGDASIQVVAVETEVWNAMECGRKVVAAGKHLHLEKPPTHEMAPFRALIEEARRKKLLVQLGYIWRFHEGVSRAIEAAKSGVLGKVHLMRGAIHTDLRPEARTALARYKGGMMFELGCHQIDRMVDLFGRPKSVKSWLQNGAGGLADNTMAVFEYDSALAVITTSAKMAGSSQHRSFEVIGTEGSMILQPVEPGTKMRIYDKGWKEIEMPPQPRYVGDFRDLARAVKTNTPLKYSYDFELLVQETVLRASGEMSS